MNLPYGLAFNLQSKCLYIVDHANHRVMSYAKNTSLPTIAAGGNGPGRATNQLLFPYAVYLDTITNDLLIANAGAEVIVRWKSNINSWLIVSGALNASSNILSTSLFSLVDVNLDPMGNIYVIDRQKHRVLFYETDQSNGVVIGGTSDVSGTNESLLNAPNSLYLDNQLNLYVTDTGNHRIQKFERY